MQEYWSIPQLWGIYIFGINIDVYHNPLSCVIYTTLYIASFPGFWHCHSYILQHFNEIFYALI